MSKADSEASLQMHPSSWGCLVSLMGCPVRWAARACEASWVSGGLGLTLDRSERGSQSCSAVGDALLSPMCTMPLGVNFTLGDAPA